MTSDAAAIVTRLLCALALLAAMTGAPVSAAEMGPVSHPGQQVLNVESNGFVNEGGAATFVRKHSTTPAMLNGNRLPSRGLAALRGPGPVD